MKLKLIIKLIFFSIIFFAALFRFYNLNWDQGFHLHPDERAIIMTVEKLSFPENIEDFFSIQSPWNPHFFAYGSFPFYLLYVVGQLLTFLDPQLATYSLLNIPGRFISATSDLALIFVLFFLGKKLFNEKIGLLTSFFYTISVLPIQLSHFYTVDTLLSLFILLTLLQLIYFYEKPTILKALFIGASFGLALATKVSAIVLVVSIGITLIIDFLLIIIKNPYKPHHWFPHIPNFLKHLILYACIIFITTITIFLLLMPYALIDFNNFWLQTIQQSAMTKDAFTFPYTLQYIGKIPYWYELKNVFFFGLGPILATLALLGTFYIFVLIIKKEKKTKWAQETILLTFFLSYFLTVGGFAIGFMRYMLPLYPLFCLFAAVFTVYIFKQIQNNSLKVVSFSLLIATLFVWPISFIQIYNQNNTRVDATNWISQNIPPRKMILVEHWDDRLPLVGSEKYLIEDLELYNPDTNEKWQKIDNQLARADYLILASNRLYIPLQKLIDCDKLPKHRCYLKTAFYYQQLFAGNLGFEKIAEFTSYATFPLFNISINDQHADESFTVYDHPKIMIFKKQ